MAGRLEGKTALITGASAGIGRATAVLFGQEGANVVAVGRSESRSRLQEVVDEIGQDQAVAVIADVRDASALESAFVAAEERFGSLNVVFNNAGGGEPSPLPITEMDEDLWNDYIAINLTGVFLGMKFGIPLLEQAGGGSIISTSSVGAIGGIANTAEYNAAKAGVHSLTRVAAAETADKNIRVNCIVPGSVATRFLLRTDAEQSEQELEARRAHGAQVSPLGRAGEGIDMANLALFLASDESSFIHRSMHRRRRRYDGCQRLAPIAGRWLQRLDRQGVKSFEVARIVGEQYEVVSQRRRGDQRIHAL